MTSGKAGPGQSLSVPLFRGQERVMFSLSWQMHPDQSYSISLDGPDGLVTGAGDDLFEALKVIRLELNPRGWMLSVQGAREDAYASGMLRNMVGARRVYIIRIGCQAEKETLVGIFAEAPLDRIATVDQQQRYFREWRSSTT